MSLTVNLASEFLVGKEDSASPLAVGLKLSGAEMWLELSPRLSAVMSTAYYSYRISHELIYCHR